jgi:3-oxoacyl-(acyl-carrier-protein) synthase
MSLRIAGMGWVTPLGCGVSAVWQRLIDGQTAAPETISSAVNSASYQAFRVAADKCPAPAHPRLRRASAISRFAAAAGLEALDNAQVKLDPATAGRTAIIFAISNGGVVYTKRFYHEVVESGAHAASPLLFPETVFNAPASHLAAILGISGASYTVVGDGAVGVLALKMAEDLMENPAIDRCLVVGAEEADWLLCDAYRRWRLLRKESPIEVFEKRPRGTILSEGAGAVLLDRAPNESNAVRIEQIDAGCNFYRRAEAAGCIERIFARLKATDSDLVVASANGTFVDAVESSALKKHAPRAAICAPKRSLGDSVGASAIWQVICGAQALRTNTVPQVIRADIGNAPPPSFTRAVISVCGLNQQVAGLSLIR